MDKDVHAETKQESVSIQTVNAAGAPVVGAEGIADFARVDGRG